MPLSTRYIVMINDALDAIPVTELTDFMRVADELEKIVSDSNEPRVFDPRFEESLLSIQEYFDPVYSYVEPHEQTEFSKLLKEQIQIRIDKFRGLTEQQRQEILTEREEGNVRRSNNQMRIATFEQNRAAHEALMAREEREFIEMQRLLFAWFAMRLERHLDFSVARSLSVWQENLLRRTRALLVNDLLPEILFNRLANSSVNFTLSLPSVSGFLLRGSVGFIPAENAYGTVATFVFAFAARFRAPYQENLSSRFQLQQPQRLRRLQRAQHSFTPFGHSKNAIIGVSLLAAMIQGFFTLTRAGLPVVSIISDVTVRNTIASMQRLEGSPFVFPTQLLMVAVLIISYALHISRDAHHEFTVARDFMDRVRIGIYGMWNQIRGNDNPPPQQDTVVIEIPDDDLPEVTHRTRSPA